MSLPLLHSPAEVISRLLILLHLATDPEANPRQAWPVYNDGEPDRPDNCLTVTDTTARSDGRSMLDGEQWQHYGFQIRVRGTTKSIAFAKAEAIRVGLCEQVRLTTVTVDDTSYQVWCTTGINVLRMGRETSSTRRHLYSVNGLAPVTRLA